MSLGYLREGQQLLYIYRGGIPTFSHCQQLRFEFPLDGPWQRSQTTSNHPIAATTILRLAFQASMFFRDRHSHHLLHLATWNSALCHERIIEFQGVGWPHETNRHDRPSATRLEAGIYSSIYTIVRVSFDCDSRRKCIFCLPRMTKYMCARLNEGGS